MINRKIHAIQADKDQNLEVRTGQGKNKEANIKLFKPRSYHQSARAKLTLDTKPEIVRFNCVIL
jgi:hypothetical protein